MKKVLILILLAFSISASFGQKVESYWFSVNGKPESSREFEVEIIDDSAATVIFYHYQMKMENGKYIKDKKGNYVRDSLISVTMLKGFYLPETGEIWMPGDMHAKKRASYVIENGKILLCWDEKRGGNWEMFLYKYNVGEVELTMGMKQSQYHSHE